MLPGYEGRAVVLVLQVLPVLLSVALAPTRGEMTPERRGTRVELPKERSQFSIL
ncbi:MAG TPA: hypothetical protein VJN70_14905 [Gemmatimonadaceae bacterium]|nr:hypothetical protein [Gemmatimonadaceae bacterium]